MAMWAIVASERGMSKIDDAFDNAPKTRTVAAARGDASAMASVASHVSEFVSWTFKKLFFDFKKMKKFF